MSQNALCCFFSLDGAFLWKKWENESEREREEFSARCVMDFFWDMKTINCFLRRKERHPAQVHFRYSTWYCVMQSDQKMSDPKCFNVSAMKRGSIFYWAKDTLVNNWLPNNNSRHYNMVIMVVRDYTVFTQPTLLPPFSPCKLHINPTRLSLHRSGVSHQFLVNQSLEVSQCRWALFEEIR